MKTLRPYQETNKAKVYEAWGAGHDNVLLVLPTGAGKTVTFCSIIQDLAIDGMFGEQEPTIVVVHRKELLSQISLTLAGEGIVHNIIAPSNVVKGIIGMQRLEYGKQFYHHNATVVIASVDTFNSRVHKYADLCKRIKRWVCDEAAHVLKDNKWGRALQLFPNARGLGVTATPERLDKKGLGSHNDGMFDHMIVGVTPRWLIQQGFLSKYKIVVPRSDYEQYLGEVKSNTSDFSKEQMAYASAKSQIIGDIVQNYKKFAFQKQTIVFASDIESAERMEKEFNEQGIPAKLLTGESSDRERFEGVNNFKNNKIWVLINVDLFDEGFDIPATADKRIVECVILGRPTMSLSKYLQMIGRGLRVSPLKDHAIVIDHVNNIRRHGLPDTERKWTLDRPERRKSKSLVRICTECAAAYPREESKCPYCGAEVTRAVGTGGRVPPETVDGDLELIDPDTIRELEAGTILESPMSIAQRVGTAAGVIAGRSAAKKQAERIDTQSELKEAIALWAGEMKASGLDDRAINKKFYIENNMTIYQALAQPKLQMKNLIKDLGYDDDKDQTV